MKLLNKIAILGLAVVSLMACERHDFIDDLTYTGKIGPQAYWEIGSKVAPAGTNVDFQAQYYTSTELNIDHSEVWYNIVEKMEKTVTCPFTTTFSYSISTTVTEEKRILQYIKTFEHSEDLWNDSLHAYYLEAAFPVSSTLATVTWKNPTEFDETKMVQFFGAGFMENFKDSLYNLMKFADFQNLYLKLGLVDNFRPFKDSTYNEVASVNQGEDVYDYHFPRVDSTLNADGTWTLICPMPDTLQQIWQDITFDQLVLNTTESKYAIEYARSYKINAELRIFDEEGTYGKTEEKEIEIN